MPVPLTVSEFSKSGDENNSVEALFTVYGAFFLMWQLKGVILRGISMRTRAKLILRTVVRDSLWHFEGLEKEEIKLYCKVALKIVHKRKDVYRLLKTFW